MLITKQKSEDSKLVEQMHSKMMKAMADMHETFSKEIRDSPRYGYCLLTTMTGLLFNIAHTSIGFSINSIRTTFNSIADKLEQSKSEHKKVPSGSKPN